MIARLGRLTRLLYLVPLLSMLTACGDLPEPFLGNPGATARRLAQPLTPLLAVPPGTDTLLPDRANQQLANADRDGAAGIRGAGDSAHTGQNRLAPDHPRSARRQLRHAAVQRAGPAGEGARQRGRRESAGA